MRSAPRLSAFALVLSLMTAVGRGQAASAKAECIDASEKAQALRDDHKLISARELFLQCAREACPKAIRKDCTTSLADVDKRIPSLTLRAKDAAGADIVAAKVSIDGAVVQTSLDGKSITLDPGVHRVRFEAEGYEPKEEQIVLADGEKDRPVIVTLTKPAASPPAKPVPVTPPPPAPAPAATPTGVYVLGGAGVAAIAAGAVFYGLGLHQRSTEISAGCGTQADCDAAKTSIRTKLVVGDVLASVGVISVVTSVVWGVTRSSAPAKDAHATTLDVRPMAGGGFATASIVF